MTLQLSLCHYNYIYDITTKPMSQQLHYVTTTKSMSLQLNL